jgi:DEAD/DEAH box helicase domain-containing protein
MHKIVFDIETKNTFQEAGSNNPADLDISLVGIYDYETAKYSSYLENELAALWPILQKTDMLIGFNSDHFDIPLLNKYSRIAGSKGAGDLGQIRSLDLMAEIKKSLGRRIGLGHVAQATLGRTKSGHGLEAITWWKKGEIDKIRKYCLEDVKITKELYEFALKNSAIKYPLGTKIMDLKIDTSEWETKSSKTVKASENNATFTLFS